MADGTGYEIEVRLWPSPTGGASPLWAARYTGTTVKSGAFNLILGGASGTPVVGAQNTDVKNAIAFSPVYLAITVTKTATGTPIANPAEILPRQQWLTVPYAVSADIAAATLPGAVTTNMMADGAISTAKLADASVSNNKLAPNSVNGVSIAANVITSSHIAGNSITADRLNLDYAMFWDEQTADEPSIVGWQTRTFNRQKKVGNSIIPSAASGTFSSFQLQPGSYLITASQTVWAANHFILGLYEVGAAAASPSLQSPPGYARVNNYAGLTSGFSQVLEVTGSTRNYEFRFNSDNADSGGLGVASPSSFGITKSQFLQVHYYSH